MWKPPGRDRIPCSYSEWSRRPVHTRWVVHQDALAHRGIRADFRKQIHELAVIGHVLGDVRVRPVRAPENALRIDAVQGARERYGISKGTLAHRHAFRAADLDPGQRVAAVK